MAHTEKCPVCDGSGKVKSNADRIIYETPVTCHGCDGKGWVTVGTKKLPAVSVDVMVKPKIDREEFDKVLDEMRRRIADGTATPLT